jgi:hypothetical protein
MLVINQSSGDNADAVIAHLPLDAASPEKTGPVVALLSPR